MAKDDKNSKEEEAQEEVPGAPTGVTHEGDPSASGVTNPGDDDK